MAVICGREEWTLPILLALAPHLSPLVFPLPLFSPPPSSAADGNGLDDRGNKEETRRGGGRGVQTEMEKFGTGNREEGGNGKMRNAGK